MAVTKGITREQLVRIVRRLLVLASSFVYIVVSFQAAYRALEVLQGTQSPITTFATSRATLIADYVGHSTIRESKLLTVVLSNSSAPRNTTLYLESLSNVSTSGCSAPDFDAELYNNAYLRGGYATFIQRSAYNLTHLLDYELIAPVVDCTLEPLVHGDLTQMRIYFLVRRIASVDDVSVLIATMAVQNYEIPDRHEEGAALIATLTLINDMRATSVTHHFAASIGYPYDTLAELEVYTFVGETSDSKWILESIPSDPTQEQGKVVHTALQRGLYLHDRSIQSNIRQMHWVLATDPTSALSDWTWQGHTVLRDTWAWVHYIHIFFGLSTLFSVLVLFLVMYRNVQLGKIWIGDAFASVSNTLVFRGVIVLISNHFNEYWAFTEICFAGGFDIADLPPLYLYADIAHADILTIFLCSVDFLGYLTKTRIDPAFTILVFEVLFYARIPIGTAVLPASVRTWFCDYVLSVVARGIPKLSPLLDQLSPMQLWTASPIPLSNIPFLVVASGSIFVIAISFIAAYVVVQKQYRRRHPERSYVQSTMSASIARRSAKTPSGLAAATDASNEHDVAQKRTFTLFEIATGAELQNRFGVIGDYDNFVVFKGMKFASADGIYCNGFVIANGKFLIAIEDLLTIVTMKLLRQRLRNVYTYQVEGSKLKQTAQIVYPDTFTWSDLLHLNVSILS